MNHLIFSQLTRAGKVLVKALGAVVLLPVVVISLAWVSRGQDDGSLLSVLNKGVSRAHADVPSCGSCSDCGGGGDLGDGACSGSSCDSHGCSDCTGCGDCSGSGDCGGCGDSSCD